METLPDASSPDGSLIEMRLARVTEIAQGSRFVAALEEVNGSRRLDLPLTRGESLPMVAHLERRTFAQPLTHELMGKLFHGLGGRLSEARISRYERQTIYA
jgi:bifunctional DNase/RNase